MIGLVAIFMEGVVVQKHSEVDGRKRIAKRLLLLAALGIGMPPFSVPGVMKDWVGELGSVIRSAAGVRP